MCMLSLALFPMLTECDGCSKIDPLLLQDNHLIKLFGRTCWLAWRACCLVVWPPDKSGVSGLSGATVTVPGAWRPRSPDLAYCVCLAYHKLACLVSGNLAYLVCLAYKMCLVSGDLAYLVCLGLGIRLIWCVWLIISSVPCVWPRLDLAYLVCLLYLVCGSWASGLSGVWGYGLSGVPALSDVWHWGIWVILCDWCLGVMAYLMGLLCLVYLVCLAHRWAHLDIW